MPQQRSAAFSIPPRPTELQLGRMRREAHHCIAAQFFSLALCFLKAPANPAL